MKREFLMLSKRRKNQDLAGYYLSEKLDGQRAFWDGGVSRGLEKWKVPWANTNGDYRYKEEPIATGLWSRYGNVIHAPDKWLDHLPKMPLDGEIYSADLMRQDLRSITSRLDSDEWFDKGVKFHVFDIPPLEAVFQDGKIKNPNMELMLEYEECIKFVYTHGGFDLYRPRLGIPFRSVIVVMQQRIYNNDVIEIVKQRKLPENTAGASEKALDILSQITDKGGEGIMLRPPYSVWTPKRSNDLLKMKKIYDDEGTVVGYISGRRTDKGSKLRGKLGALILDYNGKRLELSGFTDAERELSPKAQEWAWNHPGEELPGWAKCPEFPKGSEVTFKYSGISKDGIPQEARYWRKRCVK